MTDLRPDREVIEKGFLCPWPSLLRFPGVNEASDDDVDAAEMSDDVDITDLIEQK